MPTIGFIGTGNMGGALAKAASKNSGNTLLLCNRHPEKAQKLAAEIGGTVTDARTAAGQADYVYLGVKPQMFGELILQIKDTLAGRKTPFTLVSMMASISIEEIRTGLELSCPVIRIMPNIPVSVGEGMILWDCSDNTTEEQIQGFRESMNYAGKLSRLDEKLIDIGSGVSGCGPAYAAMFIEALADGGVACGLPRAKALEYAGQMVLGTAKLLLETGEHPGILKDAVCSPGGTTIQGVRTLEERGFRGAVTDAVIASYEKTLGIGRH